MQSFWKVDELGPLRKPPTPAQRQYWERLKARR